jgi:hypothetical protein
MTMTWLLESSICSTTCQHRRLAAPVVVSAASRFVTPVLGTIPGWPEHNRHGHAGIVEALAAGDAAIASRDHRARR